MGAGFELFGGSRDTTTDAGRKAAWGRSLRDQRRSAGTSIIDVPGLAPYWIDDVIEEVYPRPPADKPAPG
jgi:hypothetical protein